MAVGADPPARAARHQRAARAHQRLPAGARRLAGQRGRRAGAASIASRAQGRRRFEQRVSTHLRARRQAIRGTETGTCSSCRQHRSTNAARRELRKELEWDGFGVLAPGLFARPTRAGGEPGLKETVLALGISGRVAIATAHGFPHGAESIASLARDCWDLKTVATAYRGFVARFRGRRQRARRRRSPGPRAVLRAAHASDP